MVCHVRYDDREAVERGVQEALGTGPPIAVWPPRPLPPGVLLSPPRYGWISLWGPGGHSEGGPQGSPGEQAEELMARLTASLECAGMLFARPDADLWVIGVYQDGRLAARLSIPEDALDVLEAYDMAWEEMVDEGVADPATEPERWRERARELLETAGPGGHPEATPAADRWDEEPARSALARLLPPGASLEEAVRLARAGGEYDVEEGSGGTVFLEDAVETFANYLGIRDATWDPSEDFETLAAGDYEDTEGLPQDWERFVLLPLTRWELQGAGPGGHPGGRPGGRPGGMP